MMRSLSGKEEYELITILEKLIDKKLIREVIRAESVAFQFSHQKILEYVYGELSLTKRRILHEKISCCLERRLSGTSADNALYTKLMYHSRRAGNERKYLKYYVEYVYNYLNLSHEYYPVLGGETLPTDAETTFGLIRRTEPASFASSRTSKRRCRPIRANSTRATSTDSCRITTT